MKMLRVTAVITFIMAGLGCSLDTFGQSTEGGTIPMTGSGPGGDSALTDHIPTSTGSDPFTTSGTTSYGATATGMTSETAAPHGTEGTTAFDASESSSGEATLGSTGDATTGGIDNCWAEGFVNPDAPVADYMQFGPILGSHCLGTNHQDITDIERVVFLGDSITVGTPPTSAASLYRGRLADALVERFGLAPPDATWKEVNTIDGISASKDSGDFSSCAKWGSQTDDLAKMDGQLDQCFIGGQFDQRTLVIFTLGNSDLWNIAKEGIDGVPINELTMQADAAVALLRAAVHWFIDDPNKFPNGVFVLFAGVYEFSDGTANLMSCPNASLAGFDMPYPNPQELMDLIVSMNEQYMDIAVETQTDMIFLFENFCGHGFLADDPTAPCYRGLGQEKWMDLSCIHPASTGHGSVKDMFTAVIDE